MMQKSEIIKNIDYSKTYRPSEVKHIIESVTPDVKKIEYLEEGDVFLQTVGKKKRPCVIIKMSSNQDVIWAVPLSSEKSKLTFDFEFNCRFFGKGYFTKQVIVCNKEEVIKNFQGVLQSYTIVDLLKKQLNQLFSVF